VEHLSEKVGTAEHGVEEYQESRRFVTADFFLVLGKEAESEPGVLWGCSLASAGALLSGALRGMVTAGIRACPKQGGNR
jgi:hypothetical protein